MLLRQLLAPVYISLASLSRSLLVTASQDLAWPYNLPPHVKYYPEDEALVRRESDASARLQRQQPLKMRKMSTDPGEKFYLHYWSFDGQSDSNLDEWDNTTLSRTFEPALPLHADSLLPRPQNWRRYLRLTIPSPITLDKRDFVCPSGTNACTSIDRPNVCCPSSSTCQIVPDTGLGDVGCCDASETCAGSLSNCPSEYTSCPNNPGGGCCLPGYACYQEGCVQTSTTVVIVASTPSLTSTSSSSGPTTLIDTTTLIVTPSTSTSASTSSQPTLTTSTTTDLTTSTTSSTAANSLVCSTNFRSCPVSLGGGCCPTDRACGSVECPELSSTATPSPPVRGTTGTDTITGASATLTSIQGCPTGFYACSAYYQGGCCQVDRDCHSTSCPAKSGATVIDSNSVTIVAPTGNCATGWSTCAVSLGGGCCPSGYVCGTASCSASATGLSSQVGKEAPNSASYDVSQAVGRALLLSISSTALSILMIMMI